MRESFQPWHPRLTGCWSSPGSRRRRWRCWCRPRARPPARSPRPSWRGRPAPWGAGACPGRGRGRPGARPRHPSTRPCRPRPPHTASRGAARTWAANIRWMDSLVTRHVSQVACHACHTVTLSRCRRPLPAAQSLAAERPLALLGRHHGHVHLLQGGLQLARRVEGVLQIKIIETYSAIERVLADC